MLPEKRVRSAKSDMWGAEWLRPSPPQVCVGAPGQGKLQFGEGGEKEGESVAAPAFLGAGMG